MVRKVLQPFYTAYVIITFAVSILLAFPFFVLISLGNNATSRKAIYTIIRYWCIGWLWLIGMPVKIIGKRPRTGRYVIVANHISYLDTLIIFPGIPGFFRALGKKEVSKIPVVGFIYKQVVIMVDRSNPHSRAKSLRLLWRVLNKEGNIIIFPEGTFNETPAPLKEFYDGAFRLAINTQTPIFPMILPDTVHRWHYSAWWKIWPGRNRVVYLAPVPTDGMKMEDLPQLKKQVYNLMEAELIKYAMK
ncbi:MAG: 1-acyl-sn-glycerol-3-phosphate acyltransferase [Flavipsychrobacter sp.]|nr:1-acyl-sn-glycerol-3-phosphate acyltransferase [Flavipsychrobacter sp.]